LGMFLLYNVPVAGPVSVLVASTKYFCVFGNSHLLLII
jgi:hypothetical protein